MLMVEYSEAITSLVSALIGGVLALTTAYFSFKQARVRYKTELTKSQRELKVLQKQMEHERIINRHEVHKINFFNEIMNLTTYSKIKSAVDELFGNCHADRFLILIAVNGKHSFNTLSVVMEHHNRNERYSAIGKYHNIQIDNAYREMLHKVEQEDTVSLHTQQMSDCLLKSFYQMENIHYSEIMFLSRRTLDDDNDMVVYSSISTHEDKPFTRNQRTYINIVYQSKIIPAINKLMAEKNI